MLQYMAEKKDKEDYTTLVALTDFIFTGPSLHYFNFYWNDSKDTTLFATVAIQNTKQLTLLQGTCSGDATIWGGY